jgi:tetratricopeptide (TPR) repeat protein
VPEQGADSREFDGSARLFERLLLLDPENVEALVDVALVDVSLGASYLTDDRAARFALAEATATKALSLAPDFALAHMAMGAVHMLTNRAGQGIAECEQALALDRNLVEVHALIGYAKLLLGRAEETEAHVHDALRLSPRDINAFRWMFFAGSASFQFGADAEAVAWLRRSIEANRNMPLTHFSLAAALALLGQLDEARAAVQAGLSLGPGFTIRRFQRDLPSDNPTFLAARERLYEGMRLAGVPEGSA